MNKFSVLIMGLGIISYSLYAMKPEGQKDEPSSARPFRVVKSDSIDFPHVDPQCDEMAGFERQNGVFLQEYGDWQCGGGNNNRTWDSLPEQTTQHLLNEEPKYYCCALSQDNQLLAAGTRNLIVIAHLNWDKMVSKMSHFYTRTCLPEDTEVHSVSFDRTKQFLCFILKRESDWEPRGIWVLHLPSQTIVNHILSE